MKKILTLFLLLSFIHISNAQTADYYFNVLSPSSIYTSIPSYSMSLVDDGWGWDGEINSTISGELVLAPSNGGVFHYLCDSASVDYTGKFVFINQGGCEFGMHALNAQLLGASAVIFMSINNSNPIQLGAGQIGGEVTIPVVMLNITDGALIIDELIAGATVMAELSPSPNSVATITGTVVADDNDNCESDSGETPLEGWRVEAEKDGFVKYTFTNSEGGYTFFLDTGSYVVDLVSPTNDLWGACDGETVSFSNYDSTNVDLQAIALMDCPQLSVDIETPLVRRCFDNNTYWVEYCNLGTVNAEDAYIQISLDPMTSLVEASLPFSDLGGNLFEFTIGDVGVGECGSFTIGYEVSCDAMFGEAICAVAEIFPDTICVQPSSFWNGASVLVSGACDGTEVAFSISNDGFGEMVEPSEYQVIRNGELIESGTFQLEVGASQNFTFPADGATYRLETGQAIAYPEVTLPAATVEGCLPGGGEFETGFFTMFPPANYGSNYDEECEEVIGSYDPNDKNATPKGYGAEQYIEANTDITYIIRFQNTGTDTAFNIKILDTLSVLLDPTSVRPETSSHPYEFEIDGDRTAAFSFPSIMLPDSNANEKLSHGFVTFTVSQRPDVPNQSKILNSAAIYFDFNAPIITNEYFHTIGEDFLPTATVTILRPELKVDIYPNPFAEVMTFDLKGINFSSGHLKVYDAQGRAVSFSDFNQPRFDFHRNNLPAGNYFFQLSLDGNNAASGQIVIQ